MDGQSSLQFYYSGYEKCEAAHLFGPAVRVHYLIHLVISGKGTYHVGKKAYSVCAHQAFLIRPQEVTFYAADKAEPKNISRCCASRPPKISSSIQNIPSRIYQPRAASLIIHRFARFSSAMHVIRLPTTASF